MYASHGLQIFCHMGSYGGNIFCLTEGILASDLSAMRNGWLEGKRSIVGVGA